MIHLVPSDEALLKGFADGKLRRVEEGWASRLRELRDREGRSLLHLTDDPEIIQALLEAGLDPNLAASNGRTPLLRYGRCVASNRALLAAGADPNLRDRLGYDALDHQTGYCYPCIGYCMPDLAALDVLIEGTGVMITRERAQRWKECARSQVSAAVEMNEYQAFESWVDLKSR